jgi:hypothetical protein
MCSWHFELTQTKLYKMNAVDTQQRESPNQGRMKAYINCVVPVRGIKDRHRIDVARKLP